MSETRKLPVLGASACFYKTYEAENFRLLKEGGVEAIEISYNANDLKKYGFDKSPEEFLKPVRDAGLTINSFHLPFYYNFDPSALDDNACNEAMDKLCALLDKVGKCGINIAVLHPSLEPISDEERPARLERGIANVEKLCKYAANLGVKIAVENLPRTCLINCSFELLTYLNSIPELYTCFDTNHNLLQDNPSYLQDLLDNGMKGRIATIHVSDYDFVDERHRLPGNGINDWKTILELLCKLEYKGVFMYELSQEQPDGIITPHDLYENYKGLYAL